MKYKNRQDKNFKISIELGIDEIIIKLINLKRIKN